MMMKMEPTLSSSSKDERPNTTKPEYGVEMADSCSTSRQQPFIDGYQGRIYSSFFLN